VVLLVIGAVFLLPTVSKTIPNINQRACEHNLVQLQALAAVYAQQFIGPANRYPSGKGAAYWLRLTITEPPLLAKDELVSQESKTGLTSEMLQQPEALQRPIEELRARIEAELDGNR